MSCPLWIGVCNPRFPSYSAPPAVTSERRLLCVIMPKAFLKGDLAHPTPALVAHALGGLLASECFCLGLNGAVVLLPPSVCLAHLNRSQELIVREFSEYFVVCIEARSCTKEALSNQFTSYTAT